MSFLGVVSSACNGDTWSHFKPTGSTTHMLPTTQSFTMDLSRLGAAAAATQRTSRIPCMRRSVTCRPVTVETAFLLSAPCCCSLQISWK